MARPNGGVGEGAGSERDSSRAGDYRRPSARRQEGTDMAERALSPAAVTAAHELAQTVGVKLRRELVADMLAAAYRAAREQ
jgi:hypothetical protein